MTGSIDEGGADFSGGEKSGGFRFQIHFLCLLEMSLEFEVHDLSRLEICFTVVNVYIIGEAIEVDEITSENKNRRKCGI